MTTVPQPTARRRVEADQDLLTHLPPHVENREAKVGSEATTSEETISRPP
jgi:hypothetical protein